MKARRGFAFPNVMMGNFKNNIIYVRKFIGNYILCVSVFCRCKPPLASPPFIVRILAQAGRATMMRKRKQKKQASVLQNQKCPPAPNMRSTLHVLLAVARVMYFNCHKASY